MSAMLSTPVLQDGGPYHLPSTRWSLVIGAGSQDRGTAAEALEKLCKAYWRPIYSYMRHHHQESEAQDLAQDFFALVVKKDLFPKANPELGPFRAFLLTLLRRFSTGAYTRAMAMKRGGGRAPLSLDELQSEGGNLQGLVSSQNPEHDFDRAWALTVLDTATERLRKDCESAGRLQIYDVLQPYLHQRDVPQAKVAEQLGMTHGALRVAMHRLRQRFGQLVRLEIAETVTDPALVDEELKHLMAALARP